MATLSKRLSTSEKWQELYILTRHWKEDLDFYLQDISFLERMVGRYVIWIRSKENGQNVNKLLSDLQALKEKGEILNGELEVQLKTLGSLLTRAAESIPDDLASRQQTLEVHTSDFVKAFRRNRQEVYRIVEQVIDTDNPSKSLGE